MPDNITMDLISNWDDFVLIKQEYDQFINDNVSSTTLPYQFDWMVVVKSLYVNTNKTPYFITVRQSGSLIGFAPLMKETKPLSKGGVRRLCIWGEDLTSSLTNVLPDFICSTGHEDRVIASIKSYLLTVGKKDWDVLEFKFYDESNTTLPSIKKHFLSGKWKDENMDCFSIVFPTGDSELFPHIPTRRLKELRRRDRRLKEIYPDAEFKCYNTIDKTLFSQLAELHTQRQTLLSKLGHDRTILFGREQQRNILWDLIKLAERKGWLRIYTLESAGDIATFVINIMQPNTSVSLLTAFDEKYSKFSPAFLLEKHVLETEHLAGITQEINSLPGYTCVKERFSNRKRRSLKFTWINSRNLISMMRISLWAALRAPGIISTKIRQ